VDAIIGAPQRMHTVLEAECTGCELCIAPCPVDCIELRPVAGLAPRPAAKPSRRIVAVVDTSPAR
jgi:RnfABCDGE-type electron transport complex B subunit